MNHLQVLRLCAVHVNQRRGECIVEDTGLERSLHNLQHGECEALGAGQELPGVVEVKAELVGIESLGAGFLVADGSTLLVVNLIGNVENNTTEIHR